MNITQNLNSFKDTEEIERVYESYKERISKGLTEKEERLLEEAREQAHIKELVEKNLKIAVQSVEE